MSRAYRSPHCHHTLTPSFFGTSLVNGSVPLLSPFKPPCLHLRLNCDNGFEIRCGFANKLLEKLKVRVGPIHHRVATYKADNLAKQWIGTELSGIRKIQRAQSVSTPRVKYLDLMDKRTVNGYALPARYPYDAFVTQGAITLQQANTGCSCFQRR